MYLFVPQSHAFCIFLMLLDFFPFESSWIAPFIWNLIYILPSMVSFCVSDNLFSAHRWRRTSEQSHYLTDFVQYIFWYILYFWEIFYSFKPFGFDLWHGIILNTIHLSILLPFHRSIVVSFLGQILTWSGWSPKKVS